MGFQDNGNSLINDEHKIRLTLSTNAKTIITDDMEIFGITHESAFINLIFHNFKDEAKSSHYLYLQQRRQELEEIFNETNLEINSKNIAIEQILTYERKKIKESTDKNLSYKGGNKAYHIHKSNYEYLTYECEEEDNYKRPSHYIRAVIEEYCSLPFIKRERIVKKEVYDMIEQACKEKNTLIIKTKVYGEYQRFKVYPYKILHDTFRTQSYLACYSRKYNDEKSEPIVASFSILKIKYENIQKRKEKFHLNKNEIKNIESQISNNQAAYLIGNPEEIIVKFTPNGIKTFQSKLYLRPHKIKSLPNDNTFVFNCTELQAFNYFFSFGSDVEIISPESLRNKFKNIYKKGYTIYK